MTTSVLPRMPPLLDGFAASMLATRSAGTARAYAKVAREFLKRLGKRRLPQRFELERFVTFSTSGKKYAVTTRNHRLAALRALAKHAVLEGRWRHDPTEGVEFQREPPHDPAVLSVGEVGRVFDAVEASSPFDQIARDRAMLGLLFTLGLRVHELVALDVHQVAFASATLVAVRGKGNTVHDLPLAPAALALLRVWLQERVGKANDGETALFASRRGGRLSTRSVQRLFVRLRLATGTAKKVTPHTARHTAATLALLNGADISSIGELLRHSDINVTRRYVRLVDTRKRSVTELLSNVLADTLRASEHPRAAGMVAVAQAPSMSSTILLNPVKLASFAPANDIVKKPLDGKDDFAAVG